MIFIFAIQHHTFDWSDRSCTRLPAFVEPNRPSASLHCKLLPPTPLSPVQWLLYPSLIIVYPPLIPQAKPNQPCHFFLVLFLRFIYLSIYFLILFSFFLFFYFVINFVYYFFYQFFVVVVVVVVCFLINC